MPGVLSDDRSLPPRVLHWTVYGMSSDGLEDSPAEAQARFKEAIERATTREE